MSWYVQIPRISGRYEFVLLAERLMANGFEDRVEYHDGGWFDTEISSIESHLKFESEDDALAYVLTFGGEVSRNIPSREI